MNMKMRINIGDENTHLFVKNFKSGETNLFRDMTSKDGNYKENINNTLNQASIYYNKSVDHLLENTCEMEISASIFLDFIKRGKISKTGMVCSKGFRDILTLMGYKESPFEFKLDYPEPYVPRELTKEVNERIDCEGKIINEIKEEEAINVLNELINKGVDSIAVCLLWSISNNINEIKLADFIEKNSEVEYSLSHQVYPHIDENLRTLATAVDASIKKPIKEFVKSIEAHIRELGYANELKYLDFTGKYNTKDYVLKSPTAMLTPTPLVINTVKEIMASSDNNGVLLVDYKGINEDIATYVSENKYDIKNTTTIDISKINANGESVASVDDHGLFKVRSVNYDERNIEAISPSVNEANIVLGYLNNEYIMNSENRFYRKDPGKNIEDKICQKAGGTIESAAYAMYIVTCFSIINKIKSIAIAQGIDMNKLIIFGGYETFGMYAGKILNELNVSEVIMPAVGGIVSSDKKGKGSVVTEKISKKYIVNSSKYSIEDIKNMLERINAEAEKFFNDKGIGVKNRKYEYTVTAKYPNQTFELKIPFENIEDDNDFKMLVEDFHKKHYGLYYVNSPREAVEFGTWNLVATGTHGKMIEADLDVSASNEDVTCVERRSVYFEDNYVDVNVYNADKLKPGDVIKGLSVIDSDLFPILVYPQQQLSMTEEGYLRLKKIIN